jgi:hypothetical protein
MKTPPLALDGAKVSLWSPIDSRHKKTDIVRLYADGEEQVDFAGVAIAAYEKDAGSVYIFYCDSTWEVLNDCVYSDFAEAKTEAERQFEGLASTWEKL